MYHIVMFFSKQFTNTNLKEMIDVEQVIEYLKSKGVLQKDMVLKLGIERGEFLSWRRSTNKGRREEMAKKLKEAYPKIFENEKESTTIRAIARINGKKTVSTGVKVDVEDWDKKRERCRKDQNANARLETIREKIKAFINTNGRMPTTEEVTGKTDGGTIRNTILTHGKKVVARTGKQNTIKAYNSLAGNINNYQKDKNRKERRLDEVNENYLIEFQNWMITKKFSNGHAGKMMTTLRTVLKGKIDAKNYEEVKPIQMRPRDAIYLTTNEIERIETAELTPRLDNARDLFLIGYYTGQRYSDWSKIRRTEVRSIDNMEIISLTQTKTNNSTTLPVRLKLRIILEKYDDGLRMISNQKLNQYIREVAKQAGINKIVTVKEYRAQTEIERTFEKWELVTTHTARRSFATNALIAGIPITEIMKLGGWKSMNSFATYIKTTEVETALNYSTHAFFQ